MTAGKIILISLIVILSLVTGGLLIGAQAGDNIDARATAGLLYIPALFFGFIDAIAVIVYFSIYR